MMRRLHLKLMQHLIKKIALNAFFTPHFFSCMGGFPGIIERRQACHESYFNVRTCGQTSQRNVFCGLFSLWETAITAKHAYHAFCLNVGVASAQINNLIEYHTIDEADGAHDKAAIDFAVKLAKDSHADSESDFQVLEWHGFDEEEIMEITVMSGMTLFYNPPVNTTQINIDDGFANILAKKAAE